MQDNELTPNETIQLHELITLQCLNLTKSTTMSPLVSDEELKTILKSNMSTAQQNIRELRERMVDFVSASAE